MKLYEQGFPGGLAGKQSACNAGDLGSIPGLRRSTGEGNGYPLQYSGLENSMDCIVHGVTKSQTGPSDFHLHEQLSLNFFFLMRTSLMVQRLGLRVCKEGVLPLQGIRIRSLVGEPRFHSLSHGGARGVGA